MVKQHQRRQNINFMADYLFTHIDYDKYFVSVQVKLKNDWSFITVTEGLKHLFSDFLPLLYNTQWHDDDEIHYISQSDYSSP